MKTINRLLFVPLIFAAVSCGASHSDKNSSQETSQSDMPENESAANIPVVDERCNKILPLSLVSDIDNTVVSAGHVVSSESSCMAEFTAANNSDAKLYMTIETENDEARMKRRLDAFRYQPGLVEEFEAGEGAILIRTTSKHTDIMDVVFSSGKYFCVITTQIPADTDPENGVLFSYSEVKELAVNWGNHLKNE